jgi:hypothetical protein
MNCPCPRRTDAPGRCSFFALQLLRCAPVAWRSRLRRRPLPWAGVDCETGSGDFAGKTKPAHRGGPVYGLPDGCETVSWSRLLSR